MGGGGEGGPTDGLNIAQGEYLGNQPLSYQTCQGNKGWRGLGQVAIEKGFPETIIHKVFKINSSFHVG